MHPRWTLVLACAAMGACHGDTTTCAPCVSSADCHGAVCAQLGGDSFCVDACPNGNECASDQSCQAAVDVAGTQQSVCVPLGDVCGSTAPAADAGAPSGQCGTLTDPTTQASCTSCSGKSSCQPNGCYGGWWCNTATDRCQPPPTSCGGGSAFDPGAPVTGQIGAGGGTISRLLFGVVGDTRPPNIDDTAGYPSAIIGQIFGDLEALAARPPMVITTGDYMFASTSGTEAGPQLDLYLAARGRYSGMVFPAMGNHECTGATASNCGSAGADGLTTNYDTYLAKMLGPLGQPDPYYAIDVNASDGSWSAKFVFIAANAWSPAQASWLDATLARSTTYTFVVRHESKAASTAPGVTPSEQIMAKHPYTLSIVGHTHTYEHYSGREVIIGNGGAPISGGKNYGYGVVSQRGDGTLQVDMVDYASGTYDVGFRFAVHADGSPAP